MKPLNPLIYKASPKIGGGYLEKGGRRWYKLLSSWKISERRSEVA